MQSKHPSLKVYKVARILALIGIALAVLLLVFGIVFIANKNDLDFLSKMPDDYQTPDKCQQLGVTLISGAIVLGLTNAVLIFLGLKSAKHISEGQDALTLHIVMIVVGFLAFSLSSILYAVGAILAIAKPKAE